MANLNIDYRGDSPLKIIEKHILSKLHHLGSQQLLDFYKLILEKEKFEFDNNIKL